MSSPYPPFGTQNLKDDDGKVIDDFFIETDTPPDLKDATEPIPVTAAIEIPRITRVLSGTQVMSSAFTAAQLLPADPERIAFYMDVISTNTPANVTLEDYVIWADENNKLTFAMSHGRVRSGKRLELPGHTGAIWIVPNLSITASIEVTYWSITK